MTILDRLREAMDSDKATGYAAMRQSLLRECEARIRALEEVEAWAKELLHGLDLKVEQNIVEGDNGVRFCVYADEPFVAKLRTLLTERSQADLTTGSVMVSGVGPHEGRIYGGQHRILGGVAQGTEQGTPKARDDGSSPSAAPSPEPPAETR